VVGEVEMRCESCGRDDAVPGSLLCLECIEDLEEAERAMEELEFLKTPAQERPPSIE
jgi:hypothetical protein